MKKDAFFLGGKLWLALYVALGLASVPSWAMEWEPVATIPNSNWDISDRVFLRNQEELYIISDEVVSVYQIPNGRLLRRFPVPDWIEVVDDQGNPIPDSPLGNHNFSPEIRFFDKKEGTLYVSGYRIVDGSYREYRTRPWYKPKADAIMNQPFFFNGLNGSSITEYSDSNGNQSYLRRVINGLVKGNFVWKTENKPYFQSIRVIHTFNTDRNFCDQKGATRLFIQ